MASYTVTLDKQGGIGGTNTVTATYGSSMPPISFPSRLDYTFRGYFDAPNGEGFRYYDEYGGSVRNWDKQQNATLYAYWLPTGYILLGSNKNTDVIAGPSRLTQTYTVPKSDPNETPYNNIKVYFDWTFSVKAKETTLFEAWYTFPSDSSSARDDYLGRATVFISSNPSLSYDDIINNCRKTFLGYFALIAKVATAKGILAYNVNGGDPISPDYKIVPVDEALGDLPTPTRTGYQFSGWFTAASGGTRVTSSTTMPQEAYLIIYAHWGVPHTLYFNPMGGVCSETQRTLTEGQQYGTLPTPTPTRASDSFAGWYTDPYSGTKVSDTTVMIDDDVIVYARWTELTYTITYRGNNGTPSSQTVKYSRNSIIGSFPSVYRNGYDFLGWYTASTGGKKIDATTVVSANRKLYAHWAKSVSSSAEGVFWQRESVFVLD